MATSSGSPPLSLFHLLDPEVLANPYPLYARLRAEDPCTGIRISTPGWSPATRTSSRFSSRCRPTARRPRSGWRRSAWGRLGPIAAVMVRQMLFLDPPEHTRVRGLAAAAFTPRRVERLRERIQDITDTLIDAVVGERQMDVMDAIANPLPAIVTAEMFGMPTEDHRKLKDWSQDFAEMLGNFQHNPGRAARVLASVEAMSSYFRDLVRQQADKPTEGLINAFATAEVDGDRLTEEEVVANIIVTMVGGQETTTNLIGNGLLTLLRNPDQLQHLRDEPTLIPSAVEELLRYESPSQHTARIARTDIELGGTAIREGDAVIAVMGAANRDPDRFPDPDRLDLSRTDNRHLAFAWASHFCFGAPLARLEGQIVLTSLLQRLPELGLASQKVEWRPNLGLRGLVALPVEFKT